MRQKKHQPKEDIEIDSKETKETAEKQLQEYKKQLETCINDLKRLQADFENYKKRAEKENNEFREYCNKEILFDLLTLMDDFEHVTKNLHNASKEDLEKTLYMLEAKLKSLLEYYHVKGFNSLNEKFDPFKHEVLLIEEGTHEDKVIEECQKGYYYKDKILRHAKVKISKQKKHETEHEKEEPNDETSSKTDSNNK